MYFNPQDIILQVKWNTSQFLLPCLFLEVGFKHIIQALQKQTTYIVLFCKMNLIKLFIEKIIDKYFD